MTEADQILSTVQGLHDIVQTGFATLSDQIVRTNDRLTGTNERLERLEERVIEGNLRLTGQIAETNVRLGRLEDGLAETNCRVGRLEDGLSETNKRLEQLELDMGSVKVDLSSFRRDVNQRLDGIGAYLRLINGTTIEHSQRIYKLERRMDKLEGDRGTA